MEQVQALHHVFLRVIVSRDQPREHLLRLGWGLVHVVRHARFGVGLAARRARLRNLVFHLEHDKLVALHACRQHHLGFGRRAREAVQHPSPLHAIGRLHARNQELDEHFLGHYAATVQRLLGARAQFASRGDGVVQQLTRPNSRAAALFGDLVGKRGLSARRRADDDEPGGAVAVHAGRGVPQRAALAPDVTRLYEPRRAALRSLQQAALGGFEVVVDHDVVVHHRAHGDRPCVDILAGTRVALRLARVGAPIAIAARVARRPIAAGMDSCGRGRLRCAHSPHFLNALGHYPVDVALAVLFVERPAEQLRAQSGFAFGLDVHRRGLHALAAQPRDRGGVGLQKADLPGGLHAADGGVGRGIERGLALLALACFGRVGAVCTVASRSVRLGFRRSVRLGFRRSRSLDGSGARRALVVLVVRRELEVLARGVGRFHRCFRCEVEVHAVGLALERRPRGRRKRHVEVLRILGEQRVHELGHARAHGAVEAQWPRERLEVAIGGRRERVTQLHEGVLQIAVDDGHIKHVRVLSGVGNLFLRLREARLLFVGELLLARCLEHALAQRIDRRWLDIHEEGLLPTEQALPHRLGARNAEAEHAHLSVVAHGLGSRDGRAVEIAAHLRVLKEAPHRNVCLEVIPADVVVVDALLLPVARVAGGVRHGEAEAILEVALQHVDERAFADAGGAADHQRPPQARPALLDEPIGRHDVRPRARDDLLEL